MNLIDIFKDIIKKNGLQERTSQNLIQDILHSKRGEDLSVVVSDKMLRSLGYKIQIVPLETSIPARLAAVCSLSHLYILFWHIFWGN